MSWFSRKKSAPPETESAPRECLHVALVPHWDRLEDMGREDLASSWLCQSCDSHFTPAQVEALRATEAERIVSPS